MTLYLPPFYGETTPAPDQRGGVGVDDRLMRQPRLMVPRQKPVGPVRIDWTNPLTNGLIFYILYADWADNFIELVAQRQGVKVGGGFGRARGTFLTTPGTSSNYIYVPINNPTFLSSRRTLAFRKIATTNSSLSSFRFASGDINTDGSIFDGFSTGISLWMGGVTTAARIQWDVTSYAIGDVIDVIWNRNNNVGLGFFNGNLMGVVQTGTTGGNNFDFVVFGKRPSAETYYYSGTEYMALWSPYVMTERALQFAFIKDPYQFLIPA